MPSATKLAKRPKERSKPTKTNKSTKKEKNEKEKKSPVAFKSSEFIEESDSDKNEARSEVSTSEDDPIDDNPAGVPQKTKINWKQPAPSESSESDSGSEESSDSEEEDDEEESDESTEGPTAAIEPPKKPVKESTAKAVTFTPPAPYKPPSGFRAGQIQEGTKASQLLKKSNLAGKEIWYFTAPADVPIFSIENLPLKDIKSGNPAFAHEGIDYGFVQDSMLNTSHTSVLVPNASDDGYRNSSTQITKVLHLQQMVKLPGVTTSGVSSKATVPAPKPIRPQPGGLKMRFRAMGSGHRDDGDLTDEEDESTFHKPSAVDSDVEMEDALAQSSKSDRKERKEKKEKKVHKESSDGSLKRKHGEGKEKKSKSKKTERTVASAN